MGPAGVARGTILARSAPGSRARCHPGHIWSATRDIASSNSWPLWNLSSGRLESDLRITCSSSGVRPCRTTAGRFGGACMCVAVRVVERLQDSVHDSEPLWGRNLGLVHPVAQGAASDELEDQIVDVALQLHVMDLDQVRMAGPRHDLRLLQEAFQSDRIGRLDQLLDRDLAPQTRLLGQVDGAHPASAELTFEAVLADVALTANVWPRRIPRSI